ncbi:MAG: hypothetical protein D9N11_15455, partial [Ketobacter sp.]
MKLGILFLITVLIMCVAGFSQPRAGKFVPAHWSEEQQGLYFNGHSQAYTEAFIPAPKASALTIDIRLKPEFTNRRNFSTILEIMDQSDTSRIVVGQWQASLVVLQSDDYNNRLRLPKIYAPLDQERAVNHIRIRSSERGTQVHINGVLKGTNRNLVLALPTNPHTSRLVLGNNASAGSPWRGTIQSLSLYSKDTRTQSATAPELEYQFSAGVAHRVGDLSPHHLDLILPAKAVIFEKKILELPSVHDIKEPWLWLDTLVNFFGFIPFGLLLTLLLTGRAISPSNALLTTTGCAFLFSLGIELTQILMPERSSSLADLALNTAGGLSGALLILVYEKFIAKSATMPLST